MFANARSMVLPSGAPLDDYKPRPSVVDALSSNPRIQFGKGAERSAALPAHPAVDVLPGDLVKRRTISWPGITVEYIQATSGKRIEYRFQASTHLLVVWEQAARGGGETYVEGLPRSTLGILTRKLTFVPAGHEYRDWHEARSSTRVMFFHFDPAAPEVRSAIAANGASLAPRLLFEDATLWETALKVKGAAECTGPEDSAYFEALAIVLLHELIRLNRARLRPDVPARGGLAGWQQRLVTDYIEEHLAENISLSTLAQLVRLSPFHFCRAFKQSFGTPPHRYHIGRRVERAKDLLATRAVSVTDIGLTVGFSETSAFTTAFRKATGLAPTRYCRAFA